MKYLTAPLFAALLFAAPAHAFNVSTAIPTPTYPTAPATQDCASPATLTVDCPAPR